MVVHLPQGRLIEIAIVLTVLAALQFAAHLLPSPDTWRLAEVQLEAP